MNDKIDVLAVVDTTIKLAQEGYIPEHHEVVALEQARAGIAELIEAARSAEFHLTREHRAPMTVDAADYLTEVERDRNRIRAALARVGGA